MEKISDKNLQEVLDYIDSYWKRIILAPRKRKTNNKVLDSVIMRFFQTSTPNPHILEVPHTAVVPNDSKYRYIFYWDTYFIFRGLLETKREWVIPSMVENFVYLFKKYKIIPNFTHPESLGRSQPPLLTSMIFDAYSVLSREKKLTKRLQRFFRSRKTWLKKHMAIAQQEYEIVWQSPMDVDHKHYNHLVEEFQLNRYGNRDVAYATPSEQESGWDMTSRFYNRCHEFLPVDLNCFLYKYEIDFAKTAEKFDDLPKQRYWQDIAKARRKRMEIFWNEKDGFFYDYDYIHKTQSVFKSLAGFVPLWAGIATPPQAKRVVAHIKEFETDYGLTITTKDSLPPDLDLSSFAQPLQLTVKDVLKPKQWDYPNIWPPLEYLTVIGLLKYGYVEDATRIMQKSLQLHRKTFKKYHALLEKIDGVTGDMPGTYWYPTQLGFGWTNAVVYRYTKILEHIKNGQLDKVKSNSFPQELPFLA